MPNSTGIETAIARDQIRELLARIAIASDTGTPTEYLDCFSAEPTWELGQAAGLPIPASFITGREALLAGVIDRRASGVQGPGSHTAHAVSTTSISVDGSEARACTLFVYYTHTDSTPVLAAAGRYDDALIRNELGAWVLHHRTITRE